MKMKKTWYASTSKFLFHNHPVFDLFDALTLLFYLSYAEVMYPLFIKRASLNKKGIDYLSISNQWSLVLSLPLRF